MILGVWDPNSQGTQLKQDLVRVAPQAHRGRPDLQVKAWANKHMAFCSVPLQIPSLDEASQPFWNADQTIAVIFEGKIHNVAELKSSLGTGARFRTACSGEVLAHLYERFGESFLGRVNGKFSFALCDLRTEKLLLGTDHLGIEPMFYFRDGKKLVFGSSLKGLLATGWVEKELNHEAVLQYLLYCYNPGSETFLQNVRRLPAGHFLSTKGSGISIKKYWHLSFADSYAKSEDQYREEILDLIRDAIKIRLEPDRAPGIFLSGGTDSSGIVSLSSKMSSEPLHTFSFRCEGRSYDESSYARKVAELYGTHHTEVPYPSERLSLITKAAQVMDEPFCDIGIEIATYLLGEAARETVSYVFSGEGGDELFAGHPVYVADKLAWIADLVPRGIMRPLARKLAQVHDSDQKKNLQVKIKRFAYSLSFPPELLSHRWRIYYTPQELQSLCSGEFLESCNIRRIYDAILDVNSEADGKDALSRSLYSDFNTLVGFYLRRLALLRSLSVESRLPLLDYRLVEYSAKIPSRLKIRGLSGTKFIYKRALEQVLPKEILYDRPKLGHGVPMKNWLRVDGKTRTWMVEVLCDGNLEARRFFRADFIRRMVDEHQSKTQNHSHRLWALLVLELWLRSWFAR